MWHHTPNFASIQSGRPILVMNALNCLHIIIRLCVCVGHYSMLKTHHVSWFGSLNMFPVLPVEFLRDRCLIFLTSLSIVNAVHLAYLTSLTGSFTNGILLVTIVTPQQNLQMHYRSRNIVCNEFTCIVH